MRTGLATLWPTAEAVRDCIKHEAETVDRAVFLAVHQPMRFLRTEQGAERGTGRICSEADLLAEFLDENLPEGRVILPIVGSSGVGKSHVIQWLDAQLERREDRAKRHVIRVPKGTSLKGVLRLLLDGLDGPRYAALREQLLGAREKLDPEKAARLLIVNICHRLEHGAEAARGRARDGSATFDDTLLAAYGQRGALPALIGDASLLHAHWLTLPDGKKGPIGRLAEQITDEAAGPDDDRKHQLAADDFVLSPDQMEMLGPRIKKFYGSLCSGRGERRAAVAQVVNRVLDLAKQDLLELGDGSLTDLFRDVRAQLLRDGKELVLLVEDFAVLSGMQGALLQVMITEAFRDGQQVLCTMRSALAYTEGVAHVPETVRTRARSQWAIEDRPGEVEEILERTIELVGAYLNAARLGRVGLRDALAAAEGHDWVPVRGLDDLDDAARAVAEDFGATKAGHLLFPYTRAAIRQLTRWGSLKEGQVVFNPRNVINNVLDKVLRERVAFEEGTFPHAGLLQPLQSAEVTHRIINQIHDSGLQERASAVVACWGEQPPEPAAAAEIPRAVFEAFGLPAIDWGETPPRARTAEAPLASPAQEPLASRVDPGERAWQTKLEDWVTGERLDQVHARKLREWLSQGLVEFVPWGLLPLKKRYRTADLQSSVYLPRARGQGAVGPDGAFLVVADEADFEHIARRTELVRQLMAVVRVNVLDAHWDHERAHEDAGLYATFFEVRAERAIEWLRARHLQVEGETVPALVDGLLVGARALGVPGSESRRLRDRIAAIFGSAETPEDRDDGPWGRALEAFGNNREILRDMLLEQIGARQGPGAVHAIDVTVLESAVRATAATWRIASSLPDNLPRREPAARVAAAALRNLERQLPRTLDQQRRTLLEWHREATAWFGDDPDKAALRETLRSTLDTACQALPQAFDPTPLRRQIAALKGVPLKATMDACTRLEGSEDDGDILSVLAHGRDAVVRRTRELMRAYDVFLDRYVTAVETRLAQLGDDPLGDAMEGVREELAGILTGLDTLAENPS